MRFWSSPVGITVRCQSCLERAHADTSTKGMSCGGAEKPTGRCTIDQVKVARLQEYESKRDFKVTPEPRGYDDRGGKRIFVVQEHHARRLHYDLRLEKDGVLKSWAVPKGLPTKSGEKRLAIEVEDHPLAYASFEGTIPSGEYGAGTVKIWDQGMYELKVWTDDIVEFTPKGEMLKGRYVLARFKRAGEKQWLLLKAKSQTTRILWDEGLETRVHV